jgi:solute:Na+ symporter, SSS family
MSLLDWAVLAGTTLFIVIYGLWKSKGSGDMDDYLRGSHTLPWYTISLSVISTQASAITFLSAPGQAYVDGMRFVLFYLGMPLAMVFICAFMLPVYYRLNVFTAYEFLETRFDVKTRILTAFFFLIQRGLAAGISIAAPAIVLSVILGWHTSYVNFAVGGTVVLYTVLGGSKAVSQTQKLQMIIILVGMAIAGGLVVLMMPQNVSFGDAMRLAGKTDKLNTMDFNFDWDNRYNFWSGIIGGFFLQMAYFGTDQSQVGRYLGGSSMTQSRLGLLFNGIFKIPMQFGILFIGAMLFVFYQFEQPPLMFNTTEVAKVKNSPYAQEFTNLEKAHQVVFEQRKIQAQAYIEAMKTENAQQIAQAQAKYNQIEKELKNIKSQAIDLIKKNDQTANTNDANYIFLTFVMKYLPAGLIGLLIAVILFAAMSTTSSELNALASTTMVDMYKRVIYPNGTEKHYVWMSKLMTVAWGVFAILIAQAAVQLGTLIEVVNMLGSWFYGTILGIFLLAFFFKRVASDAVFISAIISEILVIMIDYKVFNLLFGWNLSVAYLWLNMIGCIAVIILSLLGTYVFGMKVNQNKLRHY